MRMREPDGPAVSVRECAFLNVMLQCLWTCDSVNAGALACMSMRACVREHERA